MKISRIILRAAQFLMALSLLTMQFQLLPIELVQGRSLNATITLSQKYMQNFDSLIFQGSKIWSDDGTLPGWYAALAKIPGSPTVLAASGGPSIPIGTLYSFGSNASLPNDRALGSIATVDSGDLYYGAKFVNNTSMQVTQLIVSYTGEQWRDAGTASGAPSAPQRLSFAYSVDAEAVFNSGTWTFFPALDFVTPVYGATGWYRLDGNAEGNHTHINASIPVSIPPDGFIWLRWKDTLESEKNHAMGVDDLTVEAVLGPVTDPAPTVVSSSPDAGAKSVAANARIQVTFSEPVTVVSGYSLMCGSEARVLSAEKAGAVYTFTPTTPLPPDTACTFTIPASSVTADSSRRKMEAGFSLSFTVTGCGAAFTPIHDIQGASDTSSSLGAKTTQGFLTTKAGEMEGYFIQSAVEESDSNSLTSEGLLVHSDNSGVSVGDYVRVSGIVCEFSSSDYDHMTGMDATALEICSPGSLTAPTYTDLSLANDVTSPDFWERYEGMLVNLTGELTVQQNAFQGHYGQITVGAGGRIFGPTNGGSPEDYLREIVLDDGSMAQYPAPIPFYPADGFLRVGDKATAVKGVIDQGAISATPSPQTFPNVYYRLQTSTDPVFVSANPRPDSPPAVPGSVRVASFNLGGYFTTLFDGSFTYPYGTYDVGGQPVTHTPHGADTLDEFNRQKEKIIAGILATDADVVGLTEMEALDRANALDDLVNALNTRAGEPAYSAVIDNVPDPDPQNNTYDFIQVALIYKVGRVTPVGDAKIDLNPVFDRVPVAQTFQDAGSGEKFTAVVSHFTSRDGCPPSGADADLGNGQGCWNARRLQQAAALLNFINNDLKPVDPDVIVIGNLNAYSEEDPIDALAAGGLVNQAAAIIPLKDRYSYISDGASGYPDHVLSTASVTRQAAGAAFWHINADEPGVIDYTTDLKTVDLYQPHVFRSSEHDPLILGLNLAANRAPETATPIPDQEAVQGRLFTYSLPASAFTDADSGDVLSFTASLADGSALPTWLSFDGVTFNGTPRAQDVQSLSITVTATDTSGAAAYDTFALIVLPNMPPAFDSIGKRMVKELETLTFMVSAKDDGFPIGNLSYSAENVPLNAAFDPKMQEFTWTPGKDQGEYPGKIYTVTFKASDGDQETSTTVEIEVYEDNIAPSFDDPGPQVINELEPYSLTLSAKDENTPAPLLAYDYISLPEGAAFNAETHTLSWTPIEAQGVDGAAGDYQAEFTVSDGSLSDTLVVNMHVSEKNTAPVLEAIGDIVIEEHEDWSLATVYSDADVPANTFTFWLEGAPAGMTVDAAGVIAWKPAEGQGGASYPVVLHLSDGKAEVSQAFTVAVRETNSDPYFTNLNNQTVDPLETLAFDVTAADDDLPGQALTIAAMGTLPDGAEFIVDSAMSKGTFYWTPDLHAAGGYKVTFSVTDEAGKTVTESITITVNEPQKVFLPVMHR